MNRPRKLTGSRGKLYFSKKKFIEKHVYVFNMFMFYVYKHKQKNVYVYSGCIIS